MRDGGRSSGVDMQVKVPNRLKLLWAKAMVVSVGEKAHKMRQVGIKKVSSKLTNVSVETPLWMESKLGTLMLPKISVGDT